MEHMNTNTRRRKIAAQVTATITAPGERSKQRSVGPSEIAGRCDYCLGRALVRKYPELDWEQPEPDRFSLKAWLGTAVHEKLERDHPHGVHESKVYITELDGYGMISGHCDLFVDETVIDFKTKDMRVLDGIKLNGPPPSEVFQINLYAYGFANAGERVEDVGLFYIPRDSNRAEDIHPVFGAYKPAVAERAIQRLEKVWDRVREGAGEVLESGSDCYPCKMKKGGWW